MSDELVTFLRTRLDEDARTAQAATAGPWHVDSTDYAEAIYDSQGAAVIGGGRWGGEASVFETTEDALHIARHDPARVLADVEAKRRIVSNLGKVIEEGETYKGPDYYEGVNACELTLKLLALPYADHSDYQSEWRP